MDALYRKYSEALRRFLVRRRVERDEVADIVQETYCRVLTSGEAEAIRHPRAYLFRVANNVALNAAKRRRTVGEDQNVDIDDVEIADEQPSAYRRLKSEQELAIVRGALTQLAPKCREVFVLNRFQQRSYAEIARELGLSVSMVEKYVSQALAHLRKAVAESR
ncbi:MAG: sigma-70 family RNA polymerase sigma factor [Rudaea sp.]|uniref:RNA polymerase sigma factor n=1 Tax=Rudaea sp. TaxID=2136325 RepID=UPI0039E667CB